MRLTAQHSNPTHSEQHRYGHKHLPPVPPPYHQEYPHSSLRTANDHADSRTETRHCSLRTSQWLHRKKSLNNLAISVSAISGIRVDDLLLSLHCLTRLFCRLYLHFLNLLLTVAKLAPRLFERDLQIFMFSGGSLYFPRLGARFCIKPLRFRFGIPNSLNL